MRKIISTHKIAMPKHKKTTNNSFISRFCRFIRKNLCCMQSYEIRDNGTDDFVDYESREMFCVGDGHFKSTNPRLFYLYDFVEMEAGQTESASESVLDERVLNVEDSYKTIDLSLNLSNCVESEKSRSESECESVVNEEISEVNDPRLFHLSLTDLVESDASQIESESECSENENVRENDNWCETIVNELIENVFIERSKRRVTFDEWIYIYDI